MLGLFSVVVAIVITIFLGGIGALVYLVARRIFSGSYRVFTAIPYGPYIVASTLILIFFRAQAQDLIFGFCTPAPPLVC
jgi:prepilin signal peptidase PulO-like enzyme (type II secretory pathway)